MDIDNYSPESNIDRKTPTKTIKKSWGSLIQGTTLNCNAQWVKVLKVLSSLPSAEILTIFCSYFGRNDDFINSFWNCLTFRWCQICWEIFFKFCAAFRECMNFKITLILFYKQHMIKKTSYTFLDFIQSLLIFVA